MCLALRSQPFSTTTGGPAGSSPFGLSGMYSRLGVEQSQTPPKPTVMPDRFVRMIGKDLTRGKMAGAFGILKDKDAIMAVLAVGYPMRIGMRFGDPEPAAVVEGHGDGLDHVGFTGEERGVKAGRQRHLGGRLIVGVGASAGGAASAAAKRSRPSAKADMR